LNDVSHHFLSSVSGELRRHRKRLYLATFLAALIGVLIHQTQWLDLRAGLMVLLAGQAGDVLALLVRNFQLSNDLNKKDAGAMNEASFSKWFAREELFIKYLSLFDTACQTTGFLLLGHALWVYTHATWLYIGIGFVYPIVFYFGVTRKKTGEALRQLRAEKQAILSPPAEAPTNS
jgi:hypothetical protein